MKISELQRILKEYQEKYGDLDVRLYDPEFETDTDLTTHNISASSHNDDIPNAIQYITIWL
jgi:hypothetical protein